MPDRHYSFKVQCPDDAELIEKAVSLHEGGRSSFFRKALKFCSRCLLKGVQIGTLNENLSTILLLCTDSRYCFIVEFVQKLTERGLTAHHLYVNADKIIDICLKV